MSATYVVGYDGSEGARAAVTFAGRLAARTGADVVAAAVYPVVPYVFGKGASDEPVTELNDNARQGAEELLRGAGAAATHAVGAGSAAEGLHLVADERRAALLVVGSTHHGRIGRMIPGSVGERLLQGSPCPVAVVPPDTADAPVKTVAVAYDGREQSRAALRTAEELAWDLGARLVVLAVHEPLAITYTGAGAGYAIADMDDELRDGLERRVGEVVAQLPDALHPSMRILDGPAPQTLVEACADGVDVLVTGSRGYGPLRSVLAGSVSRHLVDHAPCPVIVVPHAEMSDSDDEQAGGRSATVTA